MSAKIACGMAISDPPREIPRFFRFLLAEHKALDLSDLTTIMTWVTPALSRG